MTMEGDLEVGTGAQLVRRLKKLDSEGAHRLWLSTHDRLVELVGRDRSRLPLLGFHGATQETLKRLKKGSPSRGVHFFAGNVVYLQSLSPDPEVLVGNLYAMARRASFYAFSPGCSSVAREGAGGIFFFDITPFHSYEEEARKKGNLMKTEQHYHRRLGFNQLDLDPDRIVQRCFAPDPEATRCAVFGEVDKDEYTWRGDLRLNQQGFSENKGLYTAKQSGALMHGTSLTSHIGFVLPGRFLDQHIVQHALRAVLS